MRTIQLVGLVGGAPCIAYIGHVVTRDANKNVCESAVCSWIESINAQSRYWAYMVYAIDKAFPALVISLLLGVLGFVAAYFAIAWSRDTFLAQGLSGTDLLKVDRSKHTALPEKIPESLGLPCAAVYLFLVLIFIPFRYFGPSHYHVSVSSVHQDLTTFLSALLSIYSGTLLGFVDDVLDIRWRYKLPIPILSSIPMLVVYVASGGSTSVVVPAWPTFLHTFIQGASVNLGILYYAYMMLLATFCTNCVNILAGINGVEVGQAIVIALSVCANDLLYLDFGFVFRQAKDASSSSIPMHTPPEVVARHLFSLHLLLPFVGTSLALLAWNRYPSRVFVGDTYCYFAGMVLVSAGILGHYSKTLLLFFLPQMFNFLLSCPQLFGLVPCPRHRVPYVEQGKGLLIPSCVRLAKHTSAWKQLATGIVLPPLQFLRLVAPVYDTEGNQVGVSNFTLLNAILVLRGARPCAIDSAIVEQPHAQNDDPALHVNGAHETLAITEQGLWYYVMMVQVLGSLFAFGVRYWIASIVFPITN